jgi:transposase
MCLQPKPIYTVPPETARVARAAFPKGNPYLRLYDEFGQLFEDSDFQTLFPTHGQPAASPARLALVSLLQFVENLTDREAADAVRGRLDWKYLLGLELTDSGFDHTVLSEFRTRLVEASAEYQIFEMLLNTFRAKDLIKPRGKQRTDATHVLAVVRTLNRLERVGETLRAALNTLATVAPDWLRSHLSQDWWERYSTRLDNYKLPKAESERQALGASIGEDGFWLLGLIEEETELDWLTKLEAVRTLRWVWADHFSQPPQTVRLLDKQELPPAAAQITSPYELDARYTHNQRKEWVGYKIHLTETCEEDKPHLIVDVQTTPATVPDEKVTVQIYQKLAGRALLPSKHYIDGGYTNAEVIVKAKEEYAVTVVGPLQVETSPQARADEGFSQANFKVDWQAEKVTCPQGQESAQWKVGYHRSRSGQEEFGHIRIRFGDKDCKECLFRKKCTKSVEGPRELVLQPQAQYEMLHQARRYQATLDFKREYATRAGVEGTMSQAVQRCDVRHARYRGLLKNRLQDGLSAAALNLIRVSEWLDQRPFAKTRPSAFAALKLAG